MGATMQLLFLCTLVSMVSPWSWFHKKARRNRPLQVYKGVQYPWVHHGPHVVARNLADGPQCPNEEIYASADYFNRLVDIGVKNYWLGGHRVRGSRIEPRLRSSEPWDKSSFMALKERVEAAGGKILADLGEYPPEIFDKAAFLKSVAEFTKEYPVDGFRVELLYFSDDVAKSSIDLLQTVKELGKVSAIWFRSDMWHDVKRSGLGGTADINFVTIHPTGDDDIALFNTEQFAEEIIKNATLAGVDSNSLVLTVPLVALPVDGCPAYGYSQAILDFQSDPRGKGFFKSFDGIDYHFYSPARATNTARLAKKHGLHGIAVDSDSPFSKVADLDPLNPASLSHTLVQNVK
ncbi:hypothetical protein FOZ62_030122 [Perkinsus olseni]|uniref:Chitinase n=1 Tax=Perkinsus olseni TaxID=32597 RepID=A0A7J6U4J8_PEROL|nr:hypothetical protein FOZ62_030122 [Perkinsus olseni]